MIKPARTRIAMLAVICLVVFIATSLLLALGIVAALTGQPPPPAGWMLIACALAVIVVGIMLFKAAFK